MVSCSTVTDLMVERNDSMYRRINSRQPLINCLHLFKVHPSACEGFFSNGSCSQMQISIPELKSMQFYSDKSSMWANVKIWDYSTFGNLLKLHYAFLCLLNPLFLLSYNPAESPLVPLQLQLCTAHHVLSWKRLILD